MNATRTTHSALTASCGEHSQPPGQFVSESLLEG